MNDRNDRKPADPASSGGDAADSDRIERSVVIDAPQARVWRALAEAEEFGTWFGVDLKGQAFVPGQRTRGRITHAGHDHLWFEVDVDRVEAPRLLSFRWHPYAVDPAVDYGAEPPTLVTFTLHEEAPGRTRLTVVESGFDRVPAGRRREAFRMNSGGWDAQVENLRRHAAG